MKDDTIILIGFLFIICIAIGFVGGNYSSSFSVPTMKIWDSNRTYDHILLVDDVVCNPANEVNASYWNYEVVSYNKTDYIYKKWRIGNESAKGIIVCGDGR